MASKTSNFVVLAAGIAKKTRNYIELPYKCSFSYSIILYYISTPLLPFFQGFYKVFFNPPECLITFHICLGDFDNGINAVSITRANDLRRRFSEAKELNRREELKVFCSDRCGGLRHRSKLTSKPVLKDLYKYV